MPSTQLVQHFIDTHYFHPYKCLKSTTSKRPSILKCLKCGHIFSIYWKYLKHKPYNWNFCKYCKYQYKISIKSHNKLKLIKKQNRYTILKDINSNKIYKINDTHFNYWLKGKTKYLCKAQEKQLIAYHHKYLALKHHQQILDMKGTSSYKGKSTFKCLICGYTYKAYWSNFITSCHHKYSPCPNCRKYYKWLKSTIHFIYTIYNQKDSNHIFINGKYISGEKPIKCKYRSNNKIINFSQTPHELTMGIRSSKLHKSYLELFTEQYLRHINKKFHIQWKNPCILKETYYKSPYYHLHADFLLRYKNHIIMIECDGYQHFRPVHFFGGIKALISQRHRDRIKDLFCYTHNICMIRIENMKKNITISNLYKLVYKTLSTTLLPVLFDIK